MGVWLDWTRRNTRQYVLFEDLIPALASLSNHFANILPAWLQYPLAQWTMVPLGSTENGWLRYGAPWLICRNDDQDVYQIRLRVLKVCAWGANYANSAMVVQSRWRLQVSTSCLRSLQAPSVAMASGSIHLKGTDEVA